MTDETALVTRAQQGDQQALAELVETHQQTVYNVARRMCGNEHDAEETLQETFLSAITALPRSRGKANCPRGSIASPPTNAFNVAAGSTPGGSAPEMFSVEDLDADSGSENGIAAPKLFVDWSGLPEAALLDEELHDVMEDAIAALPPDLRIVFIWRDLEGLSTAETAEVVGISVANVKVRLHRARLALREQLSAYFAGREPQS